MPTLDVTNVRVVSFPVDTTVTAPDSNTFVAKANLRYGVPDKTVSMTVTPAGIAMCMTKGTFSFRNLKVLQVFTVDEVRTSA